MSTRGQHGLTLIEVMVALVIIGTALTFVSVSVGQVISSSSAMRDRTYASWIAQNQLAELRLSGELPDVGETSGEIVFAGLDWWWEINISETGVENLYRVDVDVGLPGNELRTWGVTGFVGEPIVPGQANRAWNANSPRRGERE